MKKQSAHFMTWRTERRDMSVEQVYAQMIYKLRTSKIELLCFICFNARYDDYTIADDDGYTLISACKYHRVHLAAIFKDVPKKSTDIKTVYEYYKRLFP